MFTIKSTLVHIESKFDYNQLLDCPIGGISSLSDIWKPTYFCWSKNEVETHLNRAIDLCHDILTDEKLLLSDADIKKINELQLHVNEINRQVQTYGNYCLFRY
jgi:hypothetical protein